MKKAFYAGAVMVINSIICLSDEDISDEAGAQIFEGLRQECIEFALGLKK
jgi:hypothetical protein